MVADRRRGYTEEARWWEHAEAIEMNEAYNAALFQRMQHIIAALPPLDGTAYQLNGPQRNPMATLEQLLAAKEGWDGPGSLPINRDAVEDYLRLLEAVRHHGRHVERHLEPIGAHDGSVRMEWANRGWHYSAEIQPNGTYYVCALEPRRSGADDWDKTLTELDELIDFYELSVSSWFSFTPHSWALLKKERAQLAAGKKKPCHR